MTIIDKEAWPRWAHYNFFTSISNPFYTPTLPVDVTPLRAWCRDHSLSLYPAMVSIITRAMEAVDAFHYKDRDGMIVRHDTPMSSFTDPKLGSELFQTITMEAGEDPADFCRQAKTQVAAQTEFVTSDPRDGNQFIYFTRLPRFPFIALKNEKDVNPSDLVPRAAWGHWEEEGSHTRLLLGLELNRRLPDGIHAGWFYEALSH